ncbi:MAG TPA: DUF305 domain-containing protein, partial [Acidobacteria bacterium]|nr:DUF305 domain-containing protein [Acidobacteriota bacterium]
MKIQILAGFQVPTILSTAVTLVVVAASSGAQPPIIQPGAPGEPSREITAEEASDLAAIRYTDGDVKFMQGMISHHAQALELTVLLETRTESNMMRQLAQRIDISQEDEIVMMQDWLRERDQVVPSVDTHQQAGFTPMPGMLTGEEMDRLEAASGAAFDRLFLELMIKHHRGAITMVENLLDQPGAAQGLQLYAFTSDVTSDQGIEIDRMDAMLAELSTDPRVQLAAGFDDAGQAMWNMALLASRAKPDGFYDPTTAETEEAGEDDSEERPRRGLLSFTNTDMAFTGDVLFEGNYHGFNTYRVEVPASPQLVSSVVCPGGQGDVSVIGNLLIMSVEQTRGRLDCGLQGVAEPVNTERFRGLRIFDVRDMRRPRQVAAVQTCRGSHTHTLVGDPDDEGNVYIYGSGTASVRSGEELAGCSDESPAENPDTALFRIDVIQIPLANPEAASVVSRPFVFRDAETGNVAGLWRGGDHGPATQRTSATNRCHDITAYPEIGLAAGACSGNGILLDISDPVNPVRIDEVVDPGFAYWHSATFNNDGTKVIFTDEWGGGGRARCRASDPRRWGANAIYEIIDRRLEYRSHYKLPAPQGETENCVAHNGSLVPVPGRDIMVQAWYQGGISVFDFTDSAKPFEIAYFDRGPLDADRIVMAGYWSAYWYRGFIYGTEIARGLDILELLASEFLTANEIAAASIVAPATFNAQDQRRVDWPTRPVIARAYLDQLGRADALSVGRRSVLSGLLDRADAALADGVEAALGEELTTAASEVRREADAASGHSQTRLEALAE